MPFKPILPIRVKRGVKRVLFLFIPMLIVILVTAGTGEPSTEPANRPQSVDELRGILDRLDEATAVISDQLTTRPRDYNWDVVKVTATVEPVAPVAPVDSTPLEEMGEPIGRRVARLSLEGIAWNEVNPVAFVSQEVLTLNTKIEGLQVKHIGLESVVLMDEYGHTQEMWLNQ